MLSFPDTVALSTVNPLRTKIALPYWSCNLSVMRVVPGISGRLCDGDATVVFRNAFIKANINQAGYLRTLSMLIGWNGLLLVDTSATARSGPTHSFSYLNTCKCHFF